MLLQLQNVTSSFESCAYLIKQTVNIDNCCSLHREEDSGGRFRKDFHIFFVPRKSLLCEKKLKVSAFFLSISDNLDTFAGAQLAC